MWWSNSGIDTGMVEPKLDAVRYGSITTMERADFIERLQNDAMIRMKGRK